METHSYAHTKNIELFDNYLSDFRVGSFIIFLVLIYIGMSFYQVANIQYLTIWLLVVSPVDLVKHISLGFFKKTYTPAKLLSFQKFHYVNQALSGLVWGSVCFLVLNKDMQVQDNLRMIAILSVMVAYATSVMSASLKSMLFFILPILTCMLIFFANHFSVYPWWFFSVLFLGVSCILFGFINHKHVEAQIESQLLNARYMLETDNLKSNMQEANMHLVIKNEALISAQKKLEILTVQDEMTGIYNRRFAVTLLNNSLAELRRHKADLVVVLTDIDYFKKINDTYGHAAGDDVIKGFANLLKQEIRQIDMVSRYGGEEFLMVLPKTNAIKAGKIVQRLCDIVAAKPYEFNGQQVKVTASFGLAEYVTGDTVEKLIDRADQALYRAKTAGRNNVKIFAKEDIAA